MKKNNRVVRANSIAAIAVIVASVAALFIGRYPVSPRELVGALFPFAFPSIPVSEMTRNVILTIRLPRVLLAILSGAGLSVSGAAFQALFANPLATPDTLAVATGSSFGAVVGLLFGLNGITVQICALAAGLAAILLVYSVGRIGRENSVVMLILAGMVISSLFSALVSLVKFTADPQDKLPQITFWLLGSLSGVSMKSLAVGAPAVILGIIVIYLLRWRLNAISLSEDEARSLGINVFRFRIIIIVASTLATAGIVSMCGIIGWVGLLVPHICRMAVGNDNRNVVPLSIAFGAVFMVVIDTLARSMLQTEISVSILTAIIGAPFFIFLLRKTAGSGRMH